MEDVNEFTIEEGLHQAIIVKFSYEKPELHAFRKIFPKQFEVKRFGNIGQLEFQHILIRFDLYDDYVHFVSRSNGYVKSKRDEFFSESSHGRLGSILEKNIKVSCVDLFPRSTTQRFLQKKSLISIALAVGKPLVVDKATQDRTRTSAARVKVLLDLLDKHPKKVKIHIVDNVSGKSVEFHQQVVYDNLPNYCTCFKHQGHDENSYRSMQGRNREVNKMNAGQLSMTGVELRNVEQLKGDARHLLNAKRDTNKIQETTNIEVQPAMKPTGDTSREDRRCHLDTDCDAIVVTVNRALDSINTTLEPHLGKDNVIQFDGEKEEELAGQVVNNPGNSGNVSLMLGARPIAADSLQVAALDTAVTRRYGVKGAGQLSNGQVQEMDQQSLQAGIKITTSNMEGQAHNSLVDQVENQAAPVASVVEAGKVISEGKTG
ncbi:uncharacterized protein [Nicotiana tomentosiformis]|uniref:uncharacterized protein n=1 Tax=Nicotiana tomentosiformis TaxID=4098 RepID=UPI00051C9D50|nr:uncharacterized protein LOC104103840 [Nicotiana tomentosiformis]XP_009610167.1 uncharacterized protein LOC104103840 [Nicotiana tomentosiformis]